MTPWLSVVMPIHDGERFLGATLESVAAESPDGVEFLVYDSGSNFAASQDLIADHCVKLQISCTPTPAIKPWQAKVNLGVREARASHIAILHQDDLWLPGHLDALRASIEAFPRAAMSIGPSVFIDEGGKAIGRWRLPFAPGLHSGQHVLSRLIVQNSIAVPSAAFRRDDWLATGGMHADLWYTADWDIYLKLARRGDVHVRDRATTAFRLHRESLTMTGSAQSDEFRAQLEYVLEEHRHALPKAEAPRLMRIAEAAIAMNCALADSAHGKPTAMLAGIRAMTGLELRDIPLLLRYSRPLDRIMPRLHLLLRRGAWR